MDTDDFTPSQAILPTTIVNASSLSLHLLQAVPEEEIWLAGQRSPHTRRAYKQDVAHFISVMGIRCADELRLVSRAAVVAWLNACLVLQQ